MDFPPIIGKNTILSIIFITSLLKIPNYTAKFKISNEEIAAHSNLKLDQKLNWM